jgi:hypothetical protein
MPERRFTAEEVDRAVAALAADPDRFVHAQELVTHAAPGLHRVLGEAMSAGGWHEASGGQADRVAAVDDLADRQLAIRTLAAEEARLGMLVGVAVGLELRRELEAGEPSGGQTS